MGSAALHPADKAVRRKSRRAVRRYRPTGGGYRAGLCLSTFGGPIERPRHEAVTGHFPARTEPADAIETQI